MGWRIGTLVAVVIVGAGLASGQSKRQLHAAQRLLQKIELVDGTGSKLDADTLRGMTPEQLGGDKLDQLIALVSPLGGSVSQLGTTLTALSASVDSHSSHSLPPWDHILPAAQRFESVLGGAAFLDHETGLVWEQTASTGQKQYAPALAACYQKVVGGRRGWRLATIDELATLVQPGASFPALPPGHPFNLGGNTNFWSSTVDAADSSKAWTVFFQDGTSQTTDKLLSPSVWCVRGGQGGGA